MSTFDWVIFATTILAILIYGIYRSRNTKTIDDYYLANRKMPWYIVLLSVIATQASAITYLSAPGQAYGDGMRFVQFYFGLPLAMIFISIFFLPAFRKWNVFTAYEYLEDRFDNKTRLLTAFLFLLQRGISTGITIYAPSIILSSILGLPLNWVIIITGILVIIYTVSGGTKAVSYTQQFQMGIIFGSLIIVFILFQNLLPKHVSLLDSVYLAGKLGKLNVIDWKFDLDNRYNVWSGIIGGFFLQLSYFGTDQSQVGRYLSGASESDSRRGLLMNGFIKIPMQFFILFLGVLVFVYYQFNPAPMNFNQNAELKILQSDKKDEYQSLQHTYNEMQLQRLQPTNELLNAIHAGDELKTKLLQEQLNQIETKSKKIKSEATALIKSTDSSGEYDDTNYIFLNFIMHHLPIGIVGLLMAVILLAAMGATASGLNALSSTTMMDFIHRLIKQDKYRLLYSKLTTFCWAIFSMIVALFAGQMGNLLEAVNILGSLFYGVILGIFTTALFIKRAGGNAVFLAACISESIVFYFWWFEVTSFLWLNLFGCILVMILTLVFSYLLPQQSHSKISN